uniref:Uncharacterized protein n=1 Tax=Setaria digitata TaxID=48799 RepID=A0A915PFK3_9BILA
MLLLGVLIFVALTVQLLKIRGESQSEDVWEGRKEIRQLDETTLSILWHEFENFYLDSANNDSLVVAVTAKESIVEWLEEKIGMKLPYWDYRMDSELTKAEDSSLLMMGICSQFDEATNDSLLVENLHDVENEINEQLLRIEQRCRSGALLTFLRQTFPLTNSKLLEIFRKFCNYQVRASRGDLEDEIFGKGCSRCETKNSNRWLFCHQNVHRCISKIIPNGNCMKFMNDSESCFQSTCHQGRCIQQEVMPVVKNPSNTEIRLNMSGNTTIAKNLLTYSERTSSLTRNFTLQMNSDMIPRNYTHIWGNDSIHARSSDREVLRNKCTLPESKSEQLNCTAVLEYNLSTALLKSSDLEKYYWINTSSVENKISCDKKIILTKKYLDKNRKKFRKKQTQKSRKKSKVEMNKIDIQKYAESIRFFQSDNNTFRENSPKNGRYQRKMEQLKGISKLPKRTVPCSTLSKCLKIGSDVGGVLKPYKKGMKLSANEEYEASGDKFYQILQTTTAVAALPQYVYFSITVIEGKPNRNNLLNQAVTSCNITLVGANMPYGFTEKIEGQLIQHTTSATVRTLNPELFGPLVEFNVIVTNHNGSLCQQKCLNNKGFYRQCKDRPIRLSSREFLAFSDPIEYHEKHTVMVAFASSAAPFSHPKFAFGMSVDRERLLSQEET